MSAERLLFARSPRLVGGKEAIRRHMPVCGFERYRCVSLGRNRTLFRRARRSLRHLSALIRLGPVLGHHGHRLFAAQ